MLLRRALPGPIIAPVISIHPVGDMRKAKLRAQCLHALKQLRLAVKAPIGVVSLILGLLQLFRLNHAQRHPD